MFRRVFLGFALLSIFSATTFALANDELASKFSQAQQLSTEGKTQQAIALYQDLIKSHPLLPEAYNNLAALYLKQGDSKQAKSILEQGLLAHKGYGVLYESLTAINVAMARQAYSKALQLDDKATDITIATVSLGKESLHRKNQPIVISREKPATKEKITQPPVATKAETKQANSADENDVVAVITSGAINRDPVDNVLPQPAVVPVDSPETVLKAWSAAWSAQAVDVYLSFYHKHYKPANGMSRNQWEQTRRYRLKKPRWISVSLSNFNITKNTGKQAVVSFRQAYRSNSFRDVSSKQMVLIYTDDGWRIYREKSL